MGKTPFCVSLKGLREEVKGLRFVPETGGTAVMVDEIHGLGDGDEERLDQKTFFALLHRDDGRAGLRV